MPFKGVPNKLNPEVISIISEAIKDGCNLREVADDAEITPRSLRAWVKLGRRDQENGDDTIYAQLTIAMARARASLARRLSKGIVIQSDTDWRAAQYLLERLYKKSWGKDADPITWPHEEETEVISEKKGKAGLLERFRRAQQNK